VKTAPLAGDAVMVERITTIMMIVVTVVMLTA
jgi:hypothetical protein